jgi:hypothetical protein
MIPEMSSGQISEQQSEQIAKAKWDQMTDDEKFAYSRVDSNIIQNDKAQTKPEGKYQKAEKNLTLKQATAPKEPQYIAPKPKKAMTPYTIFISKCAKELSEKEGISYKDAFKKGAEKWGTMNEEEKKPFVAEAELDQGRHEREVKEYKETGFFTNAGGVNSSTLDKIKVKPKKGAANEISEDTSEPKVEALKPKKAMVPFMFFVKTQSAIVMKENDCKSAAGAIKILGERWKTMTDDDKATYVKMNAEDQVRHDK